MSAPLTAPSVPESFPIFKLAHKYMLYDPETVSYVRREHNICGVLIGGLPQAPQQNVFSGLPLELMPEEAQLLVERDVAYIVDDVASHQRAFLYNDLSAEERRAYQAAIRRQGLSAAREKSKRTDERTKAALKQKRETENWNDVPDDILKPAFAQRAKDGEATVKPRTNSTAEGDDDSSFASPTDAKPAKADRSRDSSAAHLSGLEPYAVNPTTSCPPLQSSPPSSRDSRSLPETPQSYLLFKHLHEQGYFLAPGLRFGCQYVAYPGDPLRFHSHFLCNGMDFDQEFDLLDLVSGGRLGTGVKKGFLIGGSEHVDETSSLRASEEDSSVRAFCIEWGGM